MDFIQPRQICARPSGVQMRALLDELEAEVQLALGRSRGPDSRRRTDALWRQIGDRLNTLDGCIKSHKQWQKFWADKKSAVKKQVAARQAEGVSISAAVFTDIELRIINLLEKADSEQEEFHADPGSSSVIDTDSGIINFYTMSDSEDVQEENPLTELPIESSFVFRVKKESSASKNLDASSSRKANLRYTRSFNSKHSTKSKNTFSRIKLMQHIMKLEKRRTENVEKTSVTLASITACMKRQEEATQRLTRVLLQLVPRHIGPFQSRIHCGRPSEDQVRVLLGELESNPYLAQGKLRRKSSPLWKSIAKKLNSIEGCTKTAKQWMKYWSDKKVSVKRSLETARVLADRNGSDLTTFSDIDHRVISILENPIFEEKQEFEEADSPSMEEEYLDNDDYLSDMNEDNLLGDLENPLTTITIDTKIFPLKQESTMKQSLRSSAAQKSKQIQAKRSVERAKPYPLIWQRFLRMEERQLAAQESICSSLAEIETTMRRQEDATRELARVLTRLLR